MKDPTNKAIERIVKLSKLLAPRTRLELFAGGTIATADELGMTDEQILAVIKDGLAARRSKLEEIRRPRPRLVGLDGRPLEVAPRYPGTPEGVPMIPHGTRSDPTRRQ